MTDLQQQIGRLLLVLSYVRRHPGARLDDVAAGVGVPRGELRDELLPLLSMVGKPPFSPGNLVDVWLDDEERVHVDLNLSLGRPLRLTLGESLALRVALSAMADSGAGAYAERARALAERLGGLFRQLEPKETPQLAVTAPANPAFAVIEQAQREGRALEIVYYTASRDTVGTRVIEPWAVLEVAGAWYVVARDREQPDPRIFKLERIGTARLLEQRFEAPRDFNPRAFVAAGRFVGAGGQNLRVRVPAQLADELGREGYEVAGEVVTVPFAQPRWAAGWVASLAARAQAGVEVQAPDEVRREVRARAQEALALYQKGASE